jgi:hypothetical protein
VRKAVFSLTKQFLFSVIFHLVFSGLQARKIYGK